MGVGRMKDKSTRMLQERNIDDSDMVNKTDEWCRGEWIRDTRGD